MDSNGILPESKISAEFRARLQHMDPDDRVRAVLMLRTPGVERAPAGRQARGLRQATIDAVRTAAEQTFPEIDTILAHHDGKRLRPTVDALGAIPVETTGAGIAALAASDHVKAILEDQPLSSLHAMHLSRRA
jgi:hypothetical protein